MKTKHKHSDGIQWQWQSPPDIAPLQGIEWVETVVADDIVITRLGRGHVADRVGRSVVLELLCLEETS